jgi:uncharacterized membrane protein
MAHPITLTVLTIFLVIELVTDQLPKTPSRKTAPQFVTRLVMGAFAGAVVGSATHHTFIGLGAGMIGAVFGTLGGAAARGRLVDANGGRDRPGAFLEDAVAVGGGFLVAYLVSFV